MKRFVRVQVIPVGPVAIVELDAGEGIIAAAVDGGRGFVITARDVTDPAMQREPAGVDYPDA